MWTPSRDVTDAHRHVRIQTQVCPVSLDKLEIQTRPRNQIKCFSNYLKILSEPNKIFMLARSSLWFVASAANLP